MNEKIEVYCNGSEFVILCPFFDNIRAKGFPSCTWDKKKKIWKAPLTNHNAEYITENYDPSEIKSSAAHAIRKITKEAKIVIEGKFPSWYNFKSEPMKHQSKGLDKIWANKEVAIFWEMGLGKTYAIIHTASARFLLGQIDALLIICPTSIKEVWETELEQWCTVDYDHHILVAGDRKVKKFITNEETYRLQVLIVGIESLSLGGAYKHAESFCSTNTTMVSLDESSTIKNHNTKRTEKCINLGGMCDYRVIATGTEVSQGIEDLYSQYRFLNEKIIGHRSFYSFRNRYCIMGGFENKKIIAYRDTAKLMVLLKPYTDVVKKKNALDLPDKVYEKHIVEITKNQKELIESLDDEFYAEDDDKHIEVNTVLEKLTRTQQILGGHFPYNMSEEDNENYGTKPITGKNPKLEDLISILSQTSHEKVIIWARFVPEIEMIEETIAKEYGHHSVLSFYGKTKNRKEQTRKFQNNPECKYMVSNQAVGGMGQTWTAATIVIYYSNSFSYTDRVQSEDRAHRKGQTNKVTYIDITANHPKDKMILEAIKKKKSMAEYVSYNLK